jgi:hypothetical protein
VTYDAAPIFSYGTGKGGVVDGFQDAGAGGLRCETLTLIKVAA